MTADHVAIVSVGSNLGDKLDNCLKGIGALTGTEKIRLVGLSRFFRTSPVDFTDQAWFVNAVIKVTTALEPLPLLDELIAIQRRMGRRVDTVRFGPRVLDLDILLFDDRILTTTRLEIPHPRMHKRAFVLQPMCDIDPAIVHPVLGETVAALLARLDDDGQQVIPVHDQPECLPGRLS
ncbi:MAG: 2-amino-4-hydroxy-6-hydroxymethyldihydropteridine diphosphokinase [Desulfosarcina sp.]